MPDRYTYGDTEVLRNKLGITDAEQAREIELRLSYQRIAHLRVDPVPGAFDLVHLQRIHRYVFQDVYDWAGQIRTVDTTPVGTGIPHCRPDFIREAARAIFEDIRRETYLRKFPQDQFTARFAHHWGEVTALHPFRDGNTRSQRVFFDQLARAAGWSIDWDNINKNVHAFRDARTYAITHDSSRLRDILSPAVRPSSLEP